MPIRHMFSPITVGPVTLPNRVVRTAHTTGFGQTINNTLIEYHAARAKGGVGLSIIELLSVHQSSYPFLRGGHPETVTGYRRLMERVRPFGMKVFQQIGHLGSDVMAAGGGPPLAASDDVSANLGVLARPMTTAEIGELKAAVVAAAKDCAAGGLDGVELHMAHRYLFQQFMSPISNRRTDQYGGSFENRTRIAVELLEAVRAILPPHMAAGVRLSSEDIPGGLGPADVADIARMFVDRKLVDYVSLSMGSDHDPHKMIAAMHEPAGYQVPVNGEISRDISVPVLLIGRFRTLEEADQVVAAGDADLVALTRAHIADPELVKKTREGREDQVRPCIGCNHGCVGGLLGAGRLACTVNPAVGQEATLSEDLIVSADMGLSVLVVGGGPSGLEAARVAALSGHRVVLVEAASRLGGCVNIAKRAPRRMGIGDIIDWLEREVYRLGVDVRLSTYFQAGDLADYNPDAIVVATGSTPRIDERQMFVPGAQVLGIDRPHVLSSHEVLMASHGRDWGRAALVFDDTGHYEAIAVAEFLAEKQIQVTFATGHGTFAPGLQSSVTSEPALRRLLARGVAVHTYSQLVAVDEGSCRLTNRLGGPEIIVPADTVVLVQHNVPNCAIADELSGFAGHLAIAGDALGPRYLQAAIREGHLAARSLANVAPLSAGTICGV